MDWHPFNAFGLALVALACAALVLAVAIVTESHDVARTVCLSAAGFAVGFAVRKLHAWGSTRRSTNRR
jgi:hypothetical protein